MEWKLFDTETAYVSTAQFHADRERAPHLEQEWHRPRLDMAAQFVLQAAVTAREGSWNPGTTVSWSDLGCGDGGLLQLVRRMGMDGLFGWGYDFAPANQAGWDERGVVAEALDVFGADWEHVKVGTIASATEVLEHLTDPHGAVRRIRLAGARWLVCSSPRNENALVHDACHAWAWDMDGYRALLEGAGWTVRQHAGVGFFQVVLAEAAS